MNRPKLSIIVPVYNGDKYLNKCLDSILEQTFVDYECILINDGSTDGSKEICCAYAEKDPRIKVFHQENKGIIHARNVGLQKATGEYIHFVDADDYLFPNTEEILLKEVKSKQYDVLFFDYFEEVNGELTWVHDLELKYCMREPQCFEHILHVPYIHKRHKGRIDRKGGVYTTLWRIVFRRELVVKNHLAFEREWIRCEDREFIKKIVSKTGNMGYLPKPLYVYRIHPNSAMRTVTIHLEPQESELIDVVWDRLEARKREISSNWNNLNPIMRRTAERAYSFYELDLVLNHAGKGNVISNLDRLFSIKSFCRAFSWKYILSKPRNKYQLVLAAYKMRLYKLVEGRRFRGR